MEEMNNVGEWSGIVYDEAGLEIGESSEKMHCTNIPFRDFEISDLPYYSYEYIETLSPNM